MLSTGGYALIMYNRAYIKFIEISNSIKEKYELQDYCCIHLRMEDDALDFSSKKFNPKVGGEKSKFFSLKFFHKRILNDTELGLNNLNKKT